MRAILFRCLLLTCVVSFISVPSAQQPATTLSIDTLMATPFPTDLVAAPSGGAIAWVSSNSGVHNILIGEPTPGSGPAAGRTDLKWRAVTTYTGDDGLWITEPVFTSDGKTIVYVRGDGANRQGESPNPAQLQEGTEQAVFAVATTGGSPRRLGNGSGVAVSPKGQRVAWVQRGQIWSVDLAAAGDAPARLVNARGSASGLAFAPDGAMIAFASNRGTHSFIGVFTLASKELRYLDPSLDRDSNPIWSPDGSRLA
jgi:Tol biopolymer transport system component